MDRINKGLTILLAITISVLFLTIIIIVTTQNNDSSWKNGLNNKIDGLDNKMEKTINEMKLLIQQVEDKVSMFHWDTEDSRSTVKILESPQLTPWGDWGNWEYCPLESWVTGYNLKIEEFRGEGHIGHLDDTGLNAVELICSTKNGTRVTAITSAVGKWGHFLGDHYCYGFATGFQLKSERNQGSGDDVAAADMKLKCGDKWIHGTDIDTLGEWTDPQVCPSKTAICGIRTKIEADQGDNGDDTSLNNLELGCCPVPLWEG